MNKSDPPSEHEEVKTEDDAPSPEKQFKKIRTSPPVEEEDSPRLVDKHSFTTNSSSPATSSPTTSTKKDDTSSNTNNNTSNNSSNNTSTNNTTRHDKDTTEESLYHKRTSKQGRDKQQKIKKEITWNTRLRKPGVRFGKEKGEEGEEKEGDGENGERDPTSLPPPSPPSSPHPSDDLTLESLLKHGSGWAFPREQNGKMICIFRSCPQPLRGGTKKDYVDHLRLHQTMEHTPLYSMLRHAPPGGLIPSSGGPEDEEAPMSQVDGEWEGDEEEAEDEDTANGTNTQTGSNGTNGGGGSGGSGGAGGEEELHTPKLSQRGLQLRAQMMKYGLNIFRQDTEGRYLCFFMGCTMRMTTNFSRHIAKHEKKMDPISPDLIHLLKEGSSLDKPYMKDKKVKDGNSPLTMMMASSHLIPPPHLSHHMEGLDMSDHVSPHHPMMSSLDIREYRGPPGAHHMQHTLQHMHHQHSSPSSAQYMQHMPPHLSKLNIPPHLSLSHSQPYRHPSHPHMDLHRPPSPPQSSSPTGNPSEIRWVYRSPFPSPLSLPPNSARRPSLTPDELTPNAHSPLKHPHQSYPHSSAGSPRNPLVSPLSRLSTDDDLSLSNSSSLNSSTLHPSTFPDHTKTNSLPPSSSSSDLGAVATSLLDLRKM